ncbi:MAG: hypothetical protein WC812_03255 [Candidatus Pacearchaeota archaeon]|jgi:hypothetical protein
MTIKKYQFNNYAYGTFCSEFRENIVEKREFDKGFYNYSIFNINNTTVTLMKMGTNSKKVLTIGLNEKEIDKTIKLIKSKGFQLEEII